MLDKSFVDSYRSRPVPFGWNGLGEVVFYRTYSRTDNPNVEGMESWTDVCERVINGMYLLQQRAVSKNNWQEDKAQDSAREAFDMMWNMKWTPPGRGLSQMGTSFIMERGVVTALQNCGFISSEFLSEERGDYFRWMMERLMEGVGIGFDTKGAGTVRIHRPSEDRKITVRIQDTRESWAESVAVLYNSYTRPDAPSIEFDYSLIRPAGGIIRGFGGIASGPEPLEELHESFRTILDRGEGSLITSRDITDLGNLVGYCVVAGNVRRSAEIAFGYPFDADFLALKDYGRNPDRERFGYLSNNSIYAYRGMNYEPMVEYTWENGEPGYAWMENVHNYGRMNGVPDTNDIAVGFNPCGEQPLEHRELCTLVEIYLPHISSKAELKRAVKYAYLYAKTVTLVNHMVPDTKTREVMMKNNRIGLSFTGITQFVGKHGMDMYKEWIESAYHWSGDYDDIYSKWFGINKSVRRTSVKPSGTVSLVAGVTPGIHFNVEDRFHLRRVRMAHTSPLLPSLEASGYPIEPDVHDAKTMVVSFPVDAGEGVRSEADVTPMEQLELAAATAEYGVDNAISITVKYDKQKYTPKDMEGWLEYAETRLKDVAFLPLQGAGGYEQAPYESISEWEYNRLNSHIHRLKVDTHVDMHEADDKFCDGQACEIAEPELVEV